MQNRTLRNLKMNEIHDTESLKGAGIDADGLTATSNDV